MILLCETWSNNNEAFELDGYVYLDIYRKYKHPSARRAAGGIGIFVKNNIYKQELPVRKQIRPRPSGFELN